MDQLFDPTQYEASITTAYATIETLQETGSGISRFGSVNAKGKLLFKDDTICFAQFYRSRFVDTEAFIFACYNKPTEGREATSRRWLEFILHPEESPWKSIFPYFVSIDPDVVESTGFIVYTETDCPGDLLFNFLIAARWAYEYSSNCVSWCTLQDKMLLSSRLAFAVSTGFKVVSTPTRIKVREEGYRKDAKGKYIRDRWGDKQYFDAEYEYQEPELGNPETAPMQRICGENHTCYSGIDALVRLVKADPRLLKNPGTFRERIYGWQNGQSSWDIWTNNKAVEGHDWNPQVQTRGYHFVNLDYKSVIEWCNNLIGAAK